MSTTPRAWEPYLAGEDPPHPISCPYHEGQVLPCGRCLEWVGIPAGPVRVTDADVEAWLATLPAAEPAGR